LPPGQSPVLAVTVSTTTPAVVLTAYACLGALPHANVRWTYGKLGRIFISPAYHRPDPPAPVGHRLPERRDARRAVITRHVLVVLGAAALMAGTIVGFILARIVGIFGFHLTFSSGLA
jgi:hypothetical protein